jgi:hypothetical protein
LKVPDLKNAKFSRSKNFQIKKCNFSSIKISQLQKNTTPEGNIFTRMTNPNWLVRGAQIVKRTGTPDKCLPPGIYSLHALMNLLLLSLTQQTDNYPGTFDFFGLSEQTDQDQKRGVKTREGTFVGKL